MSLFPNEITQLFDQTFNTFKSYEQENPEKFIESLSDRIIGRVSLHDVYKHDSDDVLVASGELITYQIAKEIDGKFPWNYLGVKLETVLKHIGMSFEEFESTADQFTNYKLFKTDKDGKLLKDNMKNLTKINYDNL